MIVPMQYSSVAYKLTQAALSKNYTINFEANEIQYLMEILDELAKQPEQQQ